MNKKNLLAYALELLILIIVMAIPPLFVWIDFAILKTHLSEYSLTEFSQEFLILSSAIILFVRAYKNQKHRGFLILFAGLFMSMFIRENDYFLDKITKGLWLTIVILTLLATVFIAYKNRKTIIPTISDYQKNRGSSYLILGLFIVIIFSRIFGTGNLWKVILQENYIGYFKTAIQEGLELLGYGIIFLGVVLTGVLDEKSEQNCPNNKLE